MACLFPFVCSCLLSLLPLNSISPPFLIINACFILFTISVFSCLNAGTSEFLLLKFLTYFTALLFISLTQFELHAVELSVVAMIEHVSGCCGVLDF